MAPKRPVAASAPAEQRVAFATPLDNHLPTVTIPPGSRRRATPDAPVTPPDLSLTNDGQMRDDTVPLLGQSMPPGSATRQRSPSVPGEATSPPKRQVRAMALTPPRGCSTDELRDHFDVVVEQLKGTIEQLANAQEASVRRADLHDQQVKTLRQQFANELLGSVKSERGDTNAEFFQLRTELNAFSAILTAHSEKI